MAVSESDSDSSTTNQEASAENPRKRRRKAGTISPESTLKTTQSVPSSNRATNAASRIRPRQRRPDTGPLDGLAETEISNGKVVDARSSFATLDVAPWLIASLASMEVRRPTAIQKSCIPQILAGKDVIGSSSTGSGKTIAFAVPMIQKWATDPSAIFGLVLTPSRELALQIYEQLLAISASQGMKVLLIIGGMDLRDQAIALAKRPHVVVATPGRLADHIRTSGEDTTRGLCRVQALVLDEADRLLAPGPGSMLPDVETCLSALPPASQRQTCLFTATLTPEVTALKDIPRAKNRSPVAVCEVEFSSTLTVPPTLRQTYIQVPVSYREAYLHVLLLTARNESRKSIIVFCNRTATADLLERILRGMEHAIVSLHSKLPQRDRNSNLARFRAGMAKILVATDVASRGLDIPDVGLVINYDVPRNPDDYVHRVGRTARAGRNGDSITFVGQRDVALVLAIEGRTGSKMKEYTEDGLDIDQRVADEALKAIGEKKREVVIAIDEGRDVKGNRTQGKLRALEQ